MEKLTVKQRKFADAYIDTGNAMKAAIEAGYSENYAKAQSSKLLENVGVKSYIDERMAQLASERIMSAQEAMELLTSIARGEVKETVVVSSPQGLEETEKEADIKTRLNAIKEIMKRYPENDRMSQATLKKLEADAEIAEKKNKLLDKTDEEDDQLIIKLEL